MAIAEDYEIRKALTEGFGISPDYHIQFVRYSDDVKTVAEPMSFRYFDDNRLHERVKIKNVHLDRHEVTMENGYKVVAHFAVDHTTKTVFVKVTPIEGGNAVYWVHANV